MASMIAAIACSTSAFLGVWQWDQRGGPGGPESDRNSMKQ